MQSRAALVHLPRTGLSSCLPVTMAAARRRACPDTEDGHPCPCPLGLDCTTVTQLPAPGVGAEEGEHLSESQPCPRVTQPRGHNSSLFGLVFFSATFQVSHSVPEKLQRVQSSHQSFKAWCVVEGCRASIALGSRNEMSP